MYKKAIISRYFNEPISEIENKFSLEEIDKWVVVALTMIDQIDLAPYKTTKNASD